mmetsp:Transcript_53521/g.125577  ORF Transcript_53521/g.125577 Transcript_53521/m.125577 type:complete len:202 (-) Transcript_53521:1282-1887(-)
MYAVPAVEAACDARQVWKILVSAPAEPFVLPALVALLQHRNHFLSHVMALPISILRPCKLEVSRVREVTPHLPSNCHRVPVILRIEHQKGGLRNSSVPMWSVPDRVANSNSMHQLGTLQRAIQSSTCSLARPDKASHRFAAQRSNNIGDEGSWIRSNALPITWRAPVARAVNGDMEVASRVFGCACTGQSCYIDHKLTPEV